MVTGADLKRERTSVKISRQEIAQKLDETYSMVQRIEEGWKEMPVGFPERFRQALADIARERHEAVLAAATQ